MLTKLNDYLFVAPPIVQLFLIPLFGMAFLMFLPLIGFFLTAAALVVWVQKLFRPAEAVVDSAEALK